MRARWRAIRNVWRTPLDPSTEWTLDPSVNLHFDIARSSLCGVSLWDPVERLSFLGPADQCDYVAPALDRIFGALKGAATALYCLRYGLFGITVYFDAFGWIRAFDIEWRDTDSKRLCFSKSDGSIETVSWGLVPLSAQRCLPESKMHCVRERCDETWTVYRMNHGERSWFLYFRKPGNLQRVYCDTDPYQPTQDWSAEPEFKTDVRLDVPSINGLRVGRPAWVLHGLGVSDPVPNQFPVAPFLHIAPRTGRAIAELHRAVQRTMPVQNVFHWSRWGLSLAITKDENLRGFRLRRPRMRCDRISARRIAFLYSQWRFDWDDISTVDRVYAVCGAPDWDPAFLRYYPGEAIMYTRNDGVAVFQFDELGRTLAVEGRAFPWELYLDREFDDDSLLPRPLDQVYRPDDWGTGEPPMKEPATGIAIISSTLISSGRQLAPLPGRIRPLPHKGIVW